MIGVPASKIRTDHHHHSAHEGPASVQEPGGPDPDELHLTTVGIDVGSSTSHMMLSSITLRRLATSLSSRFVVVERRVVWRSDVMLTPYLSDGLIDAGALACFVADGYRDAGVGATEVASGAVILTGEALRRSNSRAIADALSRSSGDLVCASAGHHLEATLAAHGSGAVAESRHRAGAALHVDIGGGTTKLAMIASGRVLQTAALAVGGRLIAYDGRRRITRLEETIAPALSAAGLGLRVGDLLSEDDESRICDILASSLAAAVKGQWDDPLLRPLLLTGPLRPGGASQAAEAPSGPVTVSGGVAEYLQGPRRRFGDLAATLAESVQRKLGQSGVQLAPARQCIRATVIGASQFTVQVSGNTIGVDRSVLPLRNVPVARLEAGDSGDVPWASEDVASALRAALLRLDEGTELRNFAAVAFRWAGDPSYQRMSAVASGIVAGWGESGRRHDPLLVIVDQDVAASLARVLRATPGVPPSVCVLDGIEVGDFDYVDVGTVAEPAGVVPVVVRSLVFPA